MSFKPKSSVVIATRRRPDELRRCLDSLGSLEGGRPEIIVVDNSEGDAATAEIAGSRARYVHAPTGGLSRARTLGARAATEQVVAFIDDDAVADPAWLSAHLRAFADPAVAATTGAILPLEDGVPPHDSVSTPGQFTATASLRVDRFDPLWFERSNFGGLGNGGNMAFRRELFDAGWGFHEDLGLPLPMGGEEHFAFFELIRGGWRVEYIPEARISHRSIRTAEDHLSFRRRQVRAAYAYVVMLFVVASGFRRRTLRYVLEAARGESRDWRPESNGNDSESLPRMPSQVLAAPWYCLRRRIECRGRLQRRPPAEGPLGSVE